MRSIKVGDNVRYFWESLIYDVRIVGVRHYKGFYEMLKNEDVDKLVPDMSFEQA